MKRPFLGVGISFVVGIIISYYIKIDMIISFAIFIVSVLAYIFYCYKGKNNSSLFLFLFILLGVTITSYRLNNSLLIENVETTLEVEAVIDKVIYSDENEGKYILKVNNIELNKNKKYINEKTILKVYGENDLELGDKLKFRGVFCIPMENTNPKLYNYRKNLISKDIYTNISIKSNAIYNLDKAHKKFKYKIRASFRDNVESIFDRYLDKDNSDLIKGIVLGDATYLDEEYLKAYRDIGLGHILAVSGLHIGIIAGAMVFFLSRIGINRKWNVFLTISMIWIYGYLIGFPASILRANIMFSMLFIAGVIAEPYDSINALFLSFWILLVFNPLSIFSVGFQLSYAATFSILYFSPRLKNLFYPYENKFIYTISGLLGLYIGILPIQLYYFNSFPLMSIISNMIVSPIIFFVLILAEILLLMDFIFSPLGFIIGYVMNISLNIQDFLVNSIYKSNFLNFKFYSPNIFEIILYYILLFIVFKAFDLSRFKKNISITIYSYLILVVICTFATQITDQALEIDFIDVGQGDSALIKTRSGNYLVDTGGNTFGDFDIGKNITLPYLEKHGISKLKGIFITHFHLDHCKCVPLLMENIDIENIFISYRDTESEVYNYIMSDDIPVILLQAGDSFKLDKNIFLNVISPNSIDRDMGYDANNLSLVFNLTYFDKNILFTGDLEKEMENFIRDKINKVDILKVAHHGSDTSSTNEFLTKANPDVAIISVGKNNLYGHPSGEVIERFSNLNTDVYRTDIVGMTRVRLNREELDVIPFICDRDTSNDYLLELAFSLIYYLLAYIFIKTYIVLEEELIGFEIQ